MEEKIAVVTGTSSGFGLLTALELAKEGYHVLATMRDCSKSANLVKYAEEYGVLENIQLVELDVSSTNSISHFKRYIKKVDRIDVLVNNAGFARGGFVEEIPVNEYREQFETNVFGLIAVTQTVLPLMRKQGIGKVINISSISGRMGFPGLSPYVASKHALEGWSESLRFEMKPFGIDVILIEPGSYQTNIWSSGKQVTEKSLMHESPYYEAMEKIEGYLEKGTNNYGDPTEVAKLIAKLIKKKHTKLRYMVGKGVKLSVLLKLCIPWNLWEKVFSKQLK